MPTLLFIFVRAMQQLTSGRDVRLILLGDFWGLLTSKGVLQVVWSHATNACATSSCFSSQQLTAEADWKCHGLYIGPAVLFSLLFASAFAKDETFSVRDLSLMLESRMNLIGSCRSVASIKMSPPSFPPITRKVNTFVQRVLLCLSRCSFLYVRNMSSGLTVLSTLLIFEAMTRGMVYIPIDHACF